MSNKVLKNIGCCLPLDLRTLVSYQEGQIVSRTLTQNAAVSITLFAFAQGEEISTHESKGDALVTVMDGEATVTIGGIEHTVKTGQSIVMPANVPHAVKGATRFKMMLVVVFPER